MTLWSEYELANPELKKNNCCIKSIKKLHEERKVTQFLMKLRSDYVVRANILNHKTDPPMVSMLNELLREETRIVTQATLEDKKNESKFANRTKACSNHNLSKV